MLGAHSKTIRLGAAALVVGGAAFTGWAQDRAPAQDPGPAEGAIRTQTTTTVKKDVQVQRLSVIMNSKVLIKQDQPAGQVVDVVLSDSGCVEYLVVSHDEQSYVIPYPAAQLRYTDRVVFVDITPAQFQQVQFFPSNSWPDIYATTFRRSVYRTFGVSEDAVRSGRRESLKPILDDDVPNRRPLRDRLQNDKEEADPAKKLDPALKPERKPAAERDGNRSPVIDRERNRAPATDRNPAGTQPKADKATEPGPRPGVTDPPGPKTEPKVEPKLEEAPKPEPRP